MTDQAKEWTDEDVKNWRLGLIKQRHREVILQRRGDLVGALITEDDELPELDGSDDLDALGMVPEFELDADY